MRRREFIKTTLATLPISATLLATVQAEAIQQEDWKTLTPGLEIKKIIKVGLAEGIVYRLAGNFRVAAHRHPQGEYSYILSGQFKVRSKIYQPLEYVYRPPGSVDPVSFSGPDGAVIFVFRPAPVEPL